jgi:probable HAF family extracellular repeat protein
MGIAPLPQFGATPFIWQDGVTTSLPLPAYAINAAGTATAINNLGDACGYFFVDDPASKGWLRRACAWIDGEFIDLGTLPGFAVSHATDINDAREIVGYCEPDSGPLRGFVWRDGEMSSLADMLTTPGMIPEFANALNNSGQVAGTGLTTPGSAIVAFRLTPALPAIPGNTNCDQAVDVDDIINVILDWNADGPVGGRPADVNRDNRIDVDDLIEVILNWV